MNFGPNKSISELGEQLEKSSFATLEYFSTRLLRAFFHFKKSKAEIYSAAVTFFVVMGFPAFLLLGISLAGKIIGDTGQAQIHVMKLLKEAFPHLSPWIVKAIDDIVMAQLSRQNLSNVFNIGLIIYSTLGTIGSLIFGLNSVAGVRSKGGFVLEDIRSWIAAFFCSGYILSLVVLTHHQSFNKMSSFVYPGMAPNYISLLMKYQILPVVLTLGFFTFFYRFISRKQIKFKDAFLGSFVFTAIFILAKSFYWIYLSYARNDLMQTFGVFYTMALAVLWVYFTIAAFYYGVSVCFTPMDKKAQISSENIDKEEKSSAA